MRRIAPILLCALSLAACGSDSGGGGSASSAPGEAEYRRYACAGCHTLDGGDGTGPTFKGLAGKTVTLEGGEKVEADAAYLERAITDPGADVVEGYNASVMQAAVAGFDLGSKPDDVQRLVEFIQAQK